MGTICLQCGDKAFRNAFVYCVKCLNFALHRYCLDVIPETFDEFVHWVCDDCEFKAQLNPTLHNNREAGPTETRVLIVSEGNHEVPKNINLLSVTNEKTGNDLSENGHAKSNNALAKFDLVDCHKPAGMHSSTQPGYENDDVRDMPLPEVKNKVQQPVSSRNLGKKNGNGKVTKDASVKKIKKTKRMIKPKPTMEKHKEESKERAKAFAISAIGNKLLSKAKGKKKRWVSLRSLKEKSERYSKSPAKEKNGKGSKQIGRKRCTSLEDSKAKKSKTVVLSKNTFEEQKQVTSLIVNKPPQEGEKGNITDDNENDLCENFPTDSLISSAEPVAKPIWRGSFDIRNERRGMLSGVLGHVSILACQKVYDEALQFQTVLHLELLPKSNVWPKSFETSEPRGDHIALFFFPSKNSERDFDGLVEEMMCKELALKACVQNAELLIFNSSELPLLYWKFQGKFYLWGVFRQKKAVHPCCEELEGKSPIKCSDETLGSTKGPNALSPCSPLGNSPRTSSRI